MPRIWFRRRSCGSPGGGTGCSRWITRQANPMTLPITWLRVVTICVAVCWTDPNDLAHSDPSGVLPVLLISARFSLWNVPSKWSVRNTVRTDFRMIFRGEPMPSVTRVTQQQAAVTSGCVRTDGRVEHLTHQVATPRPPGAATARPDRSNASRGLMPQRSPRHVGVPVHAG